MDDYAKAISYERIKQNKPEKQVVFPLRYYQKQNFKEFMDLFGGNEVANVSLFCYFGGLRIFEAAKLKKKDVRVADEGSGVSIRVIGKGAKHRVTYIMEKHVVTHVKDLLNEIIDSAEYLFAKKFWKKNDCKDLEEESFRAQRVGHYIGTIIKSKTGYPTHSLRRAFATHLCKMGCEDSTIQTCMGHSKFDTTRRYIEDEVLLGKVRSDIQDRLAAKKATHLRATRRKS